MLVGQGRKKKLSKLFMWTCPCVLRYGDADEVPVWPLEVQAGLQSAACPALGRGGQEEGGGALLRQRDLLFARDLVCFARRRALRVARRRALLRHAALRGESISLLCLSLPLLSLSLPWRRRSLVLAFPCIFLFLSGRKNTNTAGPGLRLLAFDAPSSTCFFWRCKPSNRKFLRASRRFVLPAL